jgi:O-antigen ligase
MTLVLSDKELDQWAGFADKGLGLALNLFIFALPFAAITAVREITLGLAIFFWLLLMVFKKKILWPRTPLDFAYFLWVAMACLSVLTATNPSYTFREVRGEVFKDLILFYLVYFFYSYDSENKVKQLFIILILSNTVMVVFGIYDFWAQGGNLKSYWIRANSLHYVYGAFGTYLITVFPFLTVSLSFSFLSRFRAPLIALVFLNTISTFLTMGRAMWGALVVEIFLLGVVFKKKRYLISLLIIAALFVFLVPKSIWFHGENLDRPDRPVSSQIGGTLGDLLDIWKLMGSFLQERPFAGIGFGRHSFSETFKEFRAQHQPLLWHGHNMFLDITFQTGIQGLTAFLFLLSTLFVLIYKRWKNNQNFDKRLVLMALGIMLIGFFTRNLFDDYYTDDSALFFWYLIGAVLGSQEERTCG